MLKMASALIVTVAGVVAALGVSVPKMTVLKEVKQANLRYVP